MDFHPNEPLLWKTKDANGFTTNHPVVFLKAHPEDGTAEIGFGLRSDGSRDIHRVPLAELSIETAPGIRPEFKIPPPPPAPTRISIETRRDMLRECHRDATQTAETLDKANQLLKRAKSELAAAEAEASRILRIEQSKANDVTEAIRSGQPLPNGAAYQDDLAANAKHHIAARITHAEVAVTTFQREYDAAQADHRTAKANVSRAASDVVAALVESQTDELRELETVTARLRSSLRAAIALYPANNAPVAVNSETVGYLVAEPNHSIPDVASLNGKQAAVEHRQIPFKRFYEKLLTDFDAEFEWS